MKNKFETKITSKLVEINDPESGYSLKIFPNFKFKLRFHEILFDIPHEQGRHHKGTTEVKLGITGRYLKEYHRDIRKLKINPDYQYIEVGPGLGEFIPYLSRICNDPPIAIDPANYNLMWDMLLYALEIKLKNSVQERLVELVERCELMLDNKKTKLINLPLGKALEEHPEIENIADVVVENFGPSFYPYTKSGNENDEDKVKEKVLDLERRLLKPDGILIAR